MSLIKYSLDFIKFAPLSGDYPSFDRVFIIVKSLSLNAYLIDFLLIKFYRGVTKSDSSCIVQIIYSKDCNISSPY